MGLWDGEAPGAGWACTALVVGTGPALRDLDQRAYVFLLPPLQW